MQYSADSQWFVEHLVVLPGYVDFKISPKKNLIQFCSQRCILTTQMTHTL